MLNILRKRKNDGSVGMGLGLLRKLKETTCVSPVVF